jgi:hypothetical protein
LVAWAVLDDIPLEVTDVAVSGCDKLPVQQPTIERGERLARVEQAFDAE